MELKQERLAILSALDEAVGWVTGDVARASKAYDRLGSRISSAWVRNELVAMEKDGLVGRLDDRKPVCWVAHLRWATVEGGFPLCRNPVRNHVSETVSETAQRWHVADHDRMIGFYRIRNAH